MKNKSKKQAEKIDKINEKLILSDVINSVFCPKCSREMIKDIMGYYACWDYDCNMKN